MKISELASRSVLILGLGQEGRSTWRYLRATFPEKTLGVADRSPREQLSLETQALLRDDAHVQAHLGPDYLAHIIDYDVIVKAPGIPLYQPVFDAATRAGRTITSQTALFFANFAGIVIGITGTKGKSTTASLAHAILRQRYPDAQLIGNIGAPALDWLAGLKQDTPVVYELSSHQLEGLTKSPRVAVLLNIVPEHLDYYASFEQYVAAKANIARSQTKDDFLIYDADHEIPRKIAASSRATRLGCSLDGEQWAGSFLAEDHIVFRPNGGRIERVVPLSDVPLLGRFNLMNVAAAVAVGKVMGVSNERIAAAVRNFKPLEHRLERVGAFGGVTYFNDSIATVPEATIGALDALGKGIETLLLGGTERRLNFSGLAQRLLKSNVKTLILFPTTGERIWATVCAAEQQAAARAAEEDAVGLAAEENAVGLAAEEKTAPRFQHFFVETMEEAVALARQHTAPGKICLLSPASPSFGLFRDYRDRGTRFKQLVSESEPHT
jgi:UDP-N-acetylmuramoylalanine--D-glutamate ligase